MRKRFIVHSETWCYPMNTRGIIASAITGQILRSCDAIIVPGCKAKKFLMDRFQLNKDKFFLAPYATFLFDGDSKNSKLKQTEIKKELGIEGKKIVLYLSRIVEVKGLDYLVKAFFRLEKERDDVFLVIGGTGDFESKVQKLCASLRVRNVKFIGEIVDPAYKKTLYALCDVFVLPSISMPYSAPCNEAMPLVINEAMSLGKAVITTTAVGAADDLVINELNGIVVEEKNVDELYNALQKMLSDEEMQRRMGLIAKETVYSKFTYERQAEGIMNAIDFCKPKELP